MTYENFKNALFAQAEEKGFSDWEIYYSAGNSFSVRIFNGEIDEYKNAGAAGLGFRGTYQGRIGYAFTEKLDESIIPALVQNAAENAGVIEEEEIEKLYPGDTDYPQVDNYNPALNEVSVREKIDMALAMEKHAYAYDPRVKSVQYCQLGTSESMVRISNSYGMDLQDKANYAYAYVMPRVEENGVPKNGFDFWHGNDLRKFSYEKVAESAVNRALSYLGAASVESGAYPVIFDNRTACDFMGAFVSVFFAENAQKGFSLLLGKEGESIAAPVVTLRDEGISSHEGSLRKIAFDSEGVRTQKKTVIENGLLKTLLYNTKAAAKEGKTSTGNGFKGSFGGAIGTGCTNFYLVPSQTSPEDMRASISKGILITELAGLHSGVNATSGDFSVLADGFLIENGQITRPLEQITIAGNFYTFLKEIICVGSDLYFDSPTFGMPSIYVRELEVSGL